MNHAPKPKNKTPEWHGLNKKIRWGRTQIPAFGDEETWRAMLDNVGGSRSLGDMSTRGMARVVDHMAHEFKIEFSRANAAKREEKPYKAKAAQRRSDFYEIPDGPLAAQKRKICAMWKELGYDMLNLDIRTKRQCKVDLFVWCDDQAYLQKLGRDLESRLKRKREREAEAEA